MFSFPILFHESTLDGGTPAYALQAPSVRIPFAPMIRTVGGTGICYSPVWLVALSSLLRANSRSQALSRPRTLLWRSFSSLAPPLPSSPLRGMSNSIFGRTTIIIKHQSSLSLTVNLILRTREKSHQQQDPLFLPEPSASHACA